MMGGFGLGGMLFGGLIMLVFWVLVIGGVAWLVVTLVRGGQTASTSSAAGQTPVEVLKARYAKGEITREQFEQMKRDIGA